MDAHTVQLVALGLLLILAVGWGLSLVLSQRRTGDGG
jgi:hypothetical protein